MSESWRSDVLRLVSFSTSAASGVLVANSSAAVLFKIVTPPVLGGYTVPVGAALLFVSVVVGIITTLGLGSAADHLFRFLWPPHDLTASGDATNPTRTRRVVTALALLWVIVLLVAPAVVEWWAFRSFTPSRVGLSVPPLGVAAARWVYTAGRRHRPV